jgi:D-alanyl-D-alanine carboxypeptidase
MPRLAPARRFGLLGQVATAIALTASGSVIGPAQAAQSLRAVSAASFGPTALSRPVSIASLRADVQRTSDRLAAATVAWERGQQQLARLINVKIGTEKASDQLTADAYAARQRSAAFAANLYKNPIDPMLYALASGNVTSIRDFLTIRRVLGKTQQVRQADVTLLNNQAAQTKDLIDRQEAAALKALSLQSRLDEDLNRLQSDAVASLTRLQGALAELHRQKVAATLAVTGPGATCTGPVAADAINGFLPAGALCPLSTAPGQRLIAPAAAAFDKLSTTFGAEFGTALCVTDSYRDYATQIEVFRTKPNLAATPGRSQHGWGRAVDLCGGVQSNGTPPYLWLKQNAPTFGFVHPDWAEPDGSKPEPWHWEYQG